MVGDNPSLESVVKEGKTNMYNPNNSRIGTTLIQILKITTAAIMLLVGLTILISVIGFIAYLAWAEYPFMLNISFNEVLSFWGLGSFDLKLSLILLCVLPALVLIYMGIKLFKKLTVHDVIIAGVMLIIWLGAAIYIGSATNNLVMQYNKSVTVHDYSDIKENPDTLFIRLDNRYSDFEPVFNERYAPIYRDKENYIIVPDLYVREDSLLTNYKLDIEKRAFARSKSKAAKKATAAKLDYRIEGSSIIINPHVFTNEKNFDKEIFWINIVTPKNKVVVVDPMLSGRFDDY
jgi:hypothetical protein